MKTSIFLAAFIIMISASLKAQHNHQEEMPCGTTEIWNQWLTSDDRSGWPRPDLTWIDMTYSTAHFDITYSFSGYDSVSQIDLNNNFVPDYIDTVADVAEHVYDLDNARGYMMPPADEFFFPRYDIYVGNIDSFFGPGALGITAPMDDIGDNPNSAGVYEWHSTTSYLMLRHDFDSFGPHSLRYYLEVTIAHEFSHSIDMGYSAWFSQWLTESRATFEESNVYPNRHDNYGYMDALLSFPDRALNLDRSDSIPSGFLHPYGAWIFNEYVGDHSETDWMLGVLDKMRYTSYYSPSNEMKFINETLIYDQEFYLKEMLTNFFITNYEMWQDAANDPYTYLHGDTMRTSNGHAAVAEDSLHYSGTALTYYSLMQGNGRLQRASCDYIKLTSTDNFSVRMYPDGDDTSFNMVLMKLKNGTNDFEFEVCGFTDDSVFTANVRDNTEWTDYVIIIIRYDCYATDTNSKQYSLLIDGPLMFLNWSHPNTPFYTNNITAVKVDANNQLWSSVYLTEFHDPNGYVSPGFTSFNGFYWNHYHTYNTPKESGTLQFPGLVQDIDFSSDGHIWLTDGNSGAFEFDFASVQIYDDDPNEPSQWGNPQQAFYSPRKMDAQNGANVTVSSAGLGVLEISGGAATANSAFAGVTGYCVRNHGGDMYVGTSAGLMINSPTNVLTTADGLPSNIIYDVEFDAQGNLWVGTWVGGIGVYNGTSWTVYDPWNPSGGYVGNNIHDIAIDDNGTVWVASTSGLSRYRDSTWIIYNPITSDIPCYTVYDIAFTNDGCLYLGTDNGVVYFCDTTFIPPTPPDDDHSWVDHSDSQIYPSPTDDMLNIKIKVQLIDLRVYDMNGACVKTFSFDKNEISSDEFKIDVRELPAGIYLLNMNDENGLMTSERFVKM